MRWSGWQTAVAPRLPGGSPSRKDVKFRLQQLLQPWLGTEQCSGHWLFGRSVCVYNYWRWCASNAFWWLLWTACACVTDTAHWLYVTIRLPEYQVATTFSRPLHNETPSHSLLYDTLLCAASAKLFFDHEFTSAYWKLSYSAVRNLILQTNWQRSRFWWLCRRGVTVGVFVLRGRGCRTGYNECLNGNLNAAVSAAVHNDKCSLQ